MRKPILLLSATLIAVAGVCARAPADGSVQQWSIQGTAPVKVALPASDAPSSAWARAADGRWLELSPNRTDGRLELELTAEHLAGGSALVVLDPPGWLSLEDAGPPTVVLFEVDGVDMSGREHVDLGWLRDLPETVVLKVRDEHNPLDRDSIRVRSSAGLLTPRARGVTFRPDGVRGGTLTVSPPEIEGMQAATRGSVELIVDDYAIDNLQTRRSVSWSLSPRVELEDGALLLVDSVTSSGGWQDWSVLADDVIMTEADGTTAGKTWLSDTSEGEHWVRWHFPEEREVAGVELAWPWYQTWRTSRNYDVQTWDGDKWVTRIEVRDQDERQISEHRFDEPVSTTGVRVLQQPMGGQIERQDLMWLAEADVIYAE